ncbi:unnamed protein product [Paramecium sonneborni]|uniref:Protein kinase domain-containing protein n=1 Tax=Paramecium sonneborni TaxID=65129 RepID=A0A8S1QZ12_9CILI|nr:unnamed protein product [Paramecium sonneborni]
MAEDPEVILLKNRYQIQLKKEIGKGSFGIVYECLDLQNVNSDKQICAKITDRQEDPNSRREIEMLLTLQTVASGNQNIVGVIDVLVHDQQIVLILERCQGDLLNQINDNKKLQKNFLPSEALEIIKQIINGYKVLLAHNIIHRDLKPQNILYLNKTYKIADFGFARTADPYGIHTKLGTPRYSAPQLFFDVVYSNSADIYSLGIIFYLLIFGDFPFPGEDLKELKQNLMNTKTNPIKINKNLPQFQGDDSIPILIENMLKYSEEDRINWRGLIQNIQDKIAPKEIKITPPIKFIPNMPIMLGSQNQGLTQLTNLLKLVQIDVQYPVLQYPPNFFDQNQKSAIFIAIIEQELSKYMSSLQFFPKEILFIRNKLTNISYYFFNLILDLQQKLKYQNCFQSIIEVILILIKRTQRKNFKHIICKNVTKTINQIQKICFFKLRISIN